MSEIFRTQRRVEFRDTDMAGIVHFSVFFTYMEEAEHQMLRHLGMGVVTELDGVKISFPRVAAECNYRNAIRFEEIIDIEVSVVRIGTKSITYGFTFRRGEAVVADGQITAVCCKFDESHGSGKPESIATPARITEALKPYLVATA